MFEEECKMNGVKSELFYSIPDKDSKVSFCRSQIAMLRWCLEQKGDTFLCLEDDVKFSLKTFQQVIKELPNDWKLFYLGANVSDCEKYSKHLRILKSGLTTHAVAYRRKLIERIVKEYEYQEGQLYDTWLDVVIMKDTTAYIAYPMLAIQKPVNSNLWGRVVDYTSIWEASEQKLRCCDI